MSEESRNPSVGVLRDCLVEGAEAAGSNSRRLGSFLVSLVLQVGLLAALLLIPLLVAGSRPVYFGRLMPVRPYRGSPHANPEAKRGGTSRTTPRGHFEPTKPIFLPPPLIPRHVAVGEKDSSVQPSGHGGAAGEPPGLAGGGEALSDFRWIAPLVASAPAPKVAEKRASWVSEAIQQALLTHRVEPVYPVLAKQIRLEGTVELHAVIARDGVVRELEVLSGHPILARAAMEAVSQWRYRPTLLHGEPVEVETHITVIFQLRR